MAKSPESRLQEKIRKAIVSKFPGCYIYKTHGGPMQKKGLPDIVGCINGRFIAIEVKVPGRENTLTEIQKLNLEQIEASGGLAFMSTSVEHSVDTVKAYIKTKGGDSIE
jgi:Holliday junction resolvase